MLSKRNIKKRSGTRKNAKNQNNIKDVTEIIRSVFGNYNQHMYAAPPFLISPQRYSDVITISLSAGTVQSYSFRANSLFDPDRTGTGHQPLGFDQLTAIYNRYVVHKLAWYINVPSSNDTICIAAGISNGARTLTTTGDYTSFIESPLVRQQTIGYGGTPPALFTGNKSLPTFNGVDLKTYLIDDRFQSTTSTSPTEVIDLVIGFYNPSSGAVSIQVNVNLHYHAVFFDPLVLTQS